MAKEIVIIGGGIAGVTAAEEIRKKDESAKITIIERESIPLYSRVLLPHYLHGKVQREKVFIKKSDWYSEESLEYISGTEVLKIDPENKFVSISDGREISYTELIVAGGGDVRMPAFDADGVNFLRTLSDADGILARIAKIEAEGKEKKAVVYGGGFIAIEFVNALIAHGFKVTLAMRGQGFWSRQLKPEMSEILEKELAENEVELIKGVEEIDIKATDGDLEAVILDGKEIPAGLLGVGIGIIPEFELYKSAGIKTAHGVLTDEFHKTNIKKIYAIGDIAEFNDITVDRHLMTGNWLSALSHGRSVAHQIIEGDKSYELVTSYASKLINMVFVSIGDTSLEYADNVRLDAENGIQIFDRGGRTVGAIMIGNTKDRMLITQAIKQKELYEI